MLITPDYRDQLVLMRKGRKNWGPGNIKFTAALLEIMRTNDYRTVLDYGCGHGALVEQFRVAKYAAMGYDPGIREFARDPMPADFVVSLDVLEHIEPHCLDDVLKHLHSKTLQQAWLLICTRAARNKNNLPDGRNAHLLIEDTTWWRTELKAHFRQVKVSEDIRNHCLLRCKP